MNRAPKTATALAIATLTLLAGCSTTNVDPDAKAEFCTRHLPEHADKYGTEKTVVRQSTKDATLNCYTTLTEASTAQLNVHFTRALIDPLKKPPAVALRFKMVDGEPQTTPHGLVYSDFRTEDSIARLEEVTRATANLGAFGDATVEALENSWDRKKRYINPHIVLKELSTQHEFNFKWTVHTSTPRRYEFCVTDPKESHWVHYSNTKGAQFDMRYSDSGDCPAPPPKKQ